MPRKMAVNLDEIMTEGIIITRHVVYCQTSQKQKVTENFLRRCSYKLKKKEAEIFFHAELAGAIFFN